MVVDVLAFEGRAGGEAVLAVRWSVLDSVSQRLVLTAAKTYRSRAETAGHAALVAALSETLGAFNRDLSAQLRRLPRTAPVERLE